MAKKINNSQIFEKTTPKTVLEFEIFPKPKIEIDSSGYETYSYNLEEIDKQIQRIIDNYGGKCELHIKVAEMFF